MAVIIRTEATVGGEKLKGIKEYRSDRFVTEADRKRAQKLDDFLDKTMAEIRAEAIELDLLKLKGKSGALDLWYFVGDKLKFIDNPVVVAPEDQKFIWKALWDHAGDLAPGEMNSRSGTRRDHFLYCYRLAKFDKKSVETGGNWRAWVEFLDSPKINSDERILAWIGLKMKSIKKKNWIRILNRAVRQAFSDRDTSFLNEKELYSELGNLMRGLE